MPKIIDNIKETIILEARRQVLESGYSKMTVRSVAKGCGIAVGTIYNYFPSKDMLIAAFMLGDWLEALDEMKRGCAVAKSSEETFRLVYDKLILYNKKHKALFEDSAATKTYMGVFQTRHKQLRGQIADCLRLVCECYAKEYTALLPEFIAEALLVCTGERREFEEIELILGQLFN